jgi:hypothetical protein
MVFTMSNTPNKSNPIQNASSSIASIPFTAVPFFAMPTNKFEKTILVAMKNIDKDATIFYRINDQNKKVATYTKFTKPFTLSHTTYLQFYAEKKGVKSSLVNQTFYQVPTDKNIVVVSEVHPMYTAGGKDALIDGIKGTVNWKTGEWQSYFDKDFEAIIDLKKTRPVTYVGVHVLQDVSPWILFPKEVQFQISSDGKNYTPLTIIDNKISTDEKGPLVQEIGSTVKGSGRYIKVTAKTGGALPQWHESAGNPTHIFIDEVIVK